MPNQLDANGLTTSTRAELVSFFTGFFKQIYGQDIDVSSPSPDGQAIGLFIQAVLDVEDLLSQIYTSFDPDQAVGIQLDHRVAINGIQRQGGTFTQTSINITVNAAVTLFGLDQTAQPVYTVKDNAGNQYQLLVTQVIGVAGTYSFLFEAANPGHVVPSPNTITLQVTVVLPVTAVNNPSAASTLGQDEETDAALKIRRQKSVQLPAQSFHDALFAALSNIPGVTSALVFENITGTTDANGVPGHGIWVIVDGTGAPAAIAQAIYTQRSTGANMKGQQSFTVVQLDGTQFTLLWDKVVNQNLFIKFTATSIDGINAPKLAQILAQLPALLVPGVGQEVNVNEVATLVQQVDPNTLVTNAGLGLAAGGPFSNVLVPTAKNNRFIVLTGNIIITPIVLLPQTPTVARTTVQQFTAYGGTQTGRVFSLIQNQSGGGINAGTGLYTAGNVVGTDIVKVIDSGGNTATSTITVV